MSSSKSASPDTKHKESSSSSSSSSSSPSSSPAPLPKKQSATLLHEVEEKAKAPENLHHPEKIHDSSAPKIPAKVTLGDHQGLLKEVSADHSLKHPDSVHDTSAPVIENVQVKKVDRKEILKEGVVDHPPKLRDATDYVNDRSAPVIEEHATVKKTNERVALFQAIAQPTDLKKPEAVTDRSAPKVTTSSTSKCYKCGKSVYDLEMLKACDKIWHKGCFRCKHCDGVLSLKGFATIDSDPYCKPHYLEIFKSKGTYKAFSEAGENSTSYNASSGFKGY